MDGGRVVQQGTPEEVFRKPNSAFVARFLGAANVIEGRVIRAGPAGGQDGLFEARFEAEGITLAVVAEAEGEANAVIHAEDVVLSTSEPGGSSRNHLRATIVAIEQAGPVSYVELDAGHPLRATVTAASVARLHLAPGVAVIATIKATAIRLI